MPNWLIDLIEQHSTIVLFRHVFPDMDALGSQLGFSLWLKNRYPQKQIYCLGQNNSLSDKLGFQMDEVTEDVLKDSLGIILDTSNASRVDDQRFTLCKQHAESIIMFKLNHSAIKNGSMIMQVQHVRC